MTDAGSSEAPSFKTAVVGFVVSVAVLTATMVMLGSLAA
jgi:hypothetical protein